MKKIVSSIMDYVVLMVATLMLFIAFVSMYNTLNAEEYTAENRDYCYTVQTSTAE